MTDKPGEQQALGATDIDTARLEFERERHRAELALKQREQELRFEFERKQHEEELAFKQADLAFRQSSDNGVWGNPMLLAVAAGVLGLISNAVVTLVDGIENRALEHQKSEATMILEALKTGDADEAAQNLNLLVETGLSRSTRRS